MKSAFNMAAPMGEARMTPPDFLTPGALIEWERILASGIAIAEADASVLAAYCQHYDRWQTAERTIAEHGTELIIRDDKGNVKSAAPSPQIGIAAGALRGMLAAASYLGLKAKTAAARPKVRIVTGRPDASRANETSGASSATGRVGKTSRLN